MTSEIQKERSGSHCSGSYPKGFIFFCLFTFFIWILLALLLNASLTHEQNPTCRRKLCVAAKAGRIPNENVFPTQTHIREVKMVQNAHSAERGIFFYLDQLHFYRSYISDIACYWGRDGFFSFFILFDNKTNGASSYLKRRPR